MATHRVVISGSLSTWKPVMSGVPLWSVLWQILSNSFFGDMDSAIKCTLIKSADNMKQCGTVNMLERRDAIQRDLEKLERSVCVNLMEFNKAKCKVFTPELWQSETYAQVGQRSD